MFDTQAHPPPSLPLGSTDIGDLVALLTQLDTTAGDAELVDRIAALEQVKAAAAAAQARVTAAFAASQRRAQEAAGVKAERVGQGIAAQVGLARRDSPARTARYVGWATVLVGELPCTFAALERGETTEWRAMLIARETIWLSRADRAAVDSELADRLPTLGDYQVECEVRKAAYRLDPHGFVARSRAAASSRRVSLRPAPDTMSRLTALLPVAQGVAAYAALRSAADAARAAGDSRGRGQVMADTLVERVTGQSAADEVPVHIDLVMTDETFFGDAAHTGGDNAAAPHDAAAPHNAARSTATAPDIAASPTDAVGPNGEANRGSPGCSGRRANDGRGSDGEECQREGDIALSDCVDHALIAGGCDDHEGDNSSNGGELDDRTRHSDSSDDADFDDQTHDHRSDEHADHMHDHRSDDHDDSMHEHRSDEHMHDHRSDDHDDLTRDQYPRNDGWGSNEPALLVGYGPIPAGLARDLVRATNAQVWIRRLYRKPTTRQLVAMESRARVFPEGIRTAIIIRDQICRTPWCGAPIRHSDHARSVARGGETSFGNGQGLCEACNYAKQAPGWNTKPGPGGTEESVMTTTPTGHIYISRPPDLPGTADRRRESTDLCEPAHVAPPSPIVATPPSPMPARDQAA